MNLDVDPVIVNGNTREYIIDIVEDSKALLNMCIRKYNYRINSMDWYSSKELDEKDMNKIIVALQVLNFIGEN